MSPSNLKPETQRLLKYISWALAAATLLIVLLDAATNGLSESPFKKIFDLGREENVPTWFASVLWFLVSACAFCSYLAERVSGKSPAPKCSWFWLIIAGVFLVASADEVATIHESVGSMLDHSSASGPFGSVLQVGHQMQTAPESAWIVYYLPLLLMFGLSSSFFIMTRMRHLKPLLICCFLAVDCYAIAIALDHYQGVPMFRKQPIADALHMQVSELLSLSFWIEEIIEDVGTALLVVAFSGYACQQYVSKNDQS